VKPAALAIAPYFQYHTEHWTLLVIVLRVKCMRSRPTGSRGLAYADLQRHFADEKLAPDLAETREAVRPHSGIERNADCGRGCRLPVARVAYKSIKTFLRSPKSQHEDLRRRAAARGLTVPSYPALVTHKKVSAAWLVERSGFTKGYGYGRAAIIEQTRVGNCESRRSDRG